MKMSQDTFNKVVTVVLLLFSMVIFLISWLLGKPFDSNAYLTALVAPILTHVLQLISNKVKDQEGSNGNGHKKTGPLP